MRFIAIAFLGLFMAAPAMAQTGNENTSGSSGNVGHAFGSANCPQRIPCPEDSDTPVSTLISIANACITQYFGYSSPSGFFDSEVPLTSNYCLTTTPGLIPKGVGAQTNPLCCIMKMPDASCLVHCDLVTNQ